MQDIYVGQERLPFVFLEVVANGPMKRGQKDGGGIEYGEDNDGEVTLALIIYIYMASREI